MERSNSFVILTYPWQSAVDQVVAKKTAATRSLDIRQHWHSHAS